MPTWEPGSIENKWSTFQKRILEFEARKYDPDLSVPSPDVILSNLKRQGFGTAVIGDTWKYKLDSQSQSQAELKSKFTLT